jgi:NAD(P)-dependent dehydrogenase (short-subunit alcohol dehydrogenase family)
VDVLINNAGRYKSRAIENETVENFMVSITAALELAPFGIRVNAVLPGVIDTPSSLRIRPDMREQMRASTPLGRWGRAEEVANLVLFLAADESSFCTGGDYLVDGGAYA